MTNKKEQQEQQSVSDQSDSILSYMQDRFQTLLQDDRMEDAIAIGDEFFEWIRCDDDEVYLYYNEYELKELL